MPTRLTLVCHGATAATRKGRFALDEPLEDGAGERAAMLAAALRPPNVVLTSPALRARQTAAAFSPEAVIDAALRECDFGRWAGLSIEEVQAEDPDGLAAWLADPGAAPHGGEPLTDLCRRVSAWMTDIRQRNGHVLAVTHVTCIRAAILDVLQAPAAAFWRIDVEPLAVVDLRSDGARWSLRASAEAFVARRRSGGRASENQHRIEPAEGE